MKALGRTSRDTDVLIVGAGPAGLGAVAAFRHTGLKIKLVEAGRALDERCPNEPSDLVTGEGGAGLDA